MTTPVDFYLSIESIWTGVGFAAAAEVAARHRLAVRFKPVPLQDLFAATGGTPYRQRHPARRRYRDYELQRWCARRQVQIDLGSQHLPPRAQLADCMLIACAEAGHDPTALAARLLRAAWHDAQDVADPQVLLQTARHCGLPGEALVAQAGAAETTAHYRRHLDEAIAAGVFGLPSFVLHGEVFWGQDRIEMLDEALASGRPAWRPFA